MEKELSCKRVSVPCNGNRCHIDGKNSMSCLNGRQEVLYSNYFLLSSCCLSVALNNTSTSTQSET